MDRTVTITIKNTDYWDPDKYPEEAAKYNVEDDFHPEGSLTGVELFATSTSFIKLDGKWGAFLNDTWYWGSADFEEIHEDEYTEVSALYEKWGESGLYRWVYKKRGHLPEFDDYADRIRAILACEEKKYNKHGYATKDP